MLRHSRRARGCLSHIPGSQVGTFRGEKDPVQRKCRASGALQGLTASGQYSQGGNFGSKAVLTQPRWLQVGSGCPPSPGCSRLAAGVKAGAAAGLQQTLSVFAKGLSKISHRVSPSPHSWGLVTSSSFFVCVIFKGLYFKPTSPLRSALQAA